MDELKRIVVRSQNFYLLKEILYHKGVDGLWRRVIRQFENSAILREAHCGIARGHYAGETTTRKIWNNRLWWPTTRKDALEYCRQCNLCQRMGQATEKDRMPHQPVLPLEAFQMWGLDQDTHFVKKVIHESSHYEVVVHKKSTPYYPLANGLAKSINKTSQHILKKIVNEHRTDCYQKLHSALRAYRTTYKTMI